MNRVEWQQLSDQRIREANALLAASCWPGAYYLAGYAVEYALKSCILARIERTGVIFEDRKFAEQCWTHDLDVLFRQADLTSLRGVFSAQNPTFAGNWLTVKDWTEGSRYSATTQQKAEKLVAAIDDNNNGVLTWIKQHW